MNESKVPDWITRGKTISQLIKELKTFENQINLRLFPGEAAQILGAEDTWKYWSGLCVMRCAIKRRA